MVFECFWSKEIRTFNRKFTLMQHPFRSQIPKFANVSIAIIMAAKLYKVPEETCVGHLRTVGYAAQVLRFDVHTAPPQQRVGDIAGHAPPLCLFPGGMGSGTTREQAEWAQDSSFAAIQKLHATYLRGGHRRPTAGMTTRPCARSDWASRVRWGGQGGRAVAFAGCHYTPGTRHPEGPRSNQKVRPTAGPPAPQVRARLAGKKIEQGGAGGEGGGCRPGGHGNGLPQWRCATGPGGGAAPGLCTAPEIPAQGGRGARPRDEPTPPPPWCQDGTLRWGGGGGGAGGRGRGWGGGGRLAHEVLVVLVGVEVQA